LQLQREQQSPEIVILLDMNVNLKLHMEKYRKNNPIHTVINSFSSDYFISVYHGDKNITANWSEIIGEYNVLVYESSIDMIMAKARNYIEC